MNHPDGSRYTRCEPPLVVRFVWFDVSFMSNSLGIPLAPNSSSLLILCKFDVGRRLLIFCCLLRWKRRQVKTESKRAFPSDPWWLSVPPAPCKSAKSAWKGGAVSTISPDAPSPTQSAEGEIHPSNLYPFYACTITLKIQNKILKHGGWKILKKIEKFLARGFW